MSELSARTKAIARGLVVTKRARVRDMFAGGFARLISTEVGPGGAPDYWIAHDGSKIIRSFPDHRDETLTDAFADAMADAGDSPEALSEELNPGRMPTPQEDPSLYDYYDFPYRPPGYQTGIATPERILRAIEERQAKKAALK